MFTTVIGSALAVPAAAQAHHTAVPVVALDYRSGVPAFDAGDIGLLAYSGLANPRVLRGASSNPRPAGARRRGT